jgi:peroxiredoxin
MRTVGLSILYIVMMVSSLLLLAVDAAAEDCVQSKTAQELGPVRVGEKVPSFAGYTLAGPQLTRDDLLDPPGDKTPPDAIVVSFFTTYCKPCIEGLPILERVVVSHDSKAGVTVTGLLVAVGERGGKVRAFIKKHGLKLPVLEDSFQMVSQRLGVAKKAAAGSEPRPPKVPRTLVLDGKGIVRGIFLEECPADFGEKLGALIQQSVDAGRKAPAP